MGIPAPVEELDITGASFDHPAGEKAVVGEGVGAWRCAIFFDDFLGFARDIHDIGNSGLHTECEFVLFDACDGFRVA